MIHIASFGSDPSVLALSADIVSRIGLFYPDAVQHLLSNGCLDREVRSYCNTYKQGYGYWIWRPHCILKVLRTLNDNDVLMYIDGDMQIQPTATHIPFIDEFLGTRADAAVHSMHYVEKHWTSADVADLFGLSIDSPEMQTGQYAATFMLLRKNAQTLEFVTKWHDLVMDNLDKCRSGPYVLNNAPAFSDNRHDQSVLSLLCKTTTSITVQTVLDILPLQFSNKRTRSFHERMTTAYQAFNVHSGNADKDATLIPLQVASFPECIARFLQYCMPTPPGLLITDIAELPSNPVRSRMFETAFNAFKSDKSTSHNYHLVYGAFVPIDTKRLLEIGIGTNNPDLVSSMGPSGTPGASLRAFAECLPDARIFGADVDVDILFESERIKTTFVDQLNIESFNSVFRSERFDVVIDDGLHSAVANFNTIHFALNRLNKGGVIFVEDINAEAFPLWTILDALLKLKGLRTYMIRTKIAYMYVIQT